MAEEKKYVVLASLAASMTDPNLKTKYLFVCKPTIIYLIFILMLPYNILSCHAFSKLIQF